MKKDSLIKFVLAGLGILCLPPATFADHFIFNANEPSGPGIVVPIGGDPSIGAAIWTNASNTIGTIALPGNTYEVLPDGNAIGAQNGGSGIEALVRAYGATDTNANEIPDWTNGPKFIFIGSYFPGDSLTLNTNTELRFKSPGLDAINFPGTNGNPGLILNGGTLESGSASYQGGWPSGTIEHIVKGLIELVPGTVNYVSTDDFNLPVDIGRNIQLDGQLVGTGSLALLQGGIASVNLLITGSNANFGGTFYDKAGWLVFAGANNNSFGNNSSLVVDPEFLLSVPPFDSYIYRHNAVLNGPAMVEFDYDVNTSGSLTLLHGGQLNLHQTCFFSAVSIEGISLSPGYYSYEDLSSAFTNFVSGGSGSITVRPYQATLAGLAKTDVMFFSGGNLVLAGHGGTPGDSYRLLTSTTLKPGSWTPFSTNYFSGNGDFVVSAPVSLSDKQRFFTIASP